MDTVSFSCMHCERRLKVDAQYAGRCVLCPKCRNKTVVPESEEAAGTYGVLLDASVEKAPARRRTPAEIWKSDGYTNLLDRQRASLGEGRALAECGDWQKAVLVLTKLYRSLGGTRTRQNAVVRRPLSHCLVQWSVSDLRAIKDENLRLSKPLRALLKRAGDMRKWGGAFDVSRCGVCLESLRTIGGCATVKTAVGTAFVCCAAPTQDDHKLVTLYDSVWRRLSLAGALDEDNEEVRPALARIPEWHELLSDPDNRSQWSEQIAAEGGEKNAGGEALAELLMGFVQGLAGG